MGSAEVKPRQRLRVPNASHASLSSMREAQQLAVYLGWLLHKTKGGLVAAAIFVMPGRCSSSCRPSSRTSGNLISFLLIASHSFMGPNGRSKS